MQRNTSLQSGITRNALSSKPMHLLGQHAKLGLRGPHCPAPLRLHPVLCPHSLLPRGVGRHKKGPRVTREATPRGGRARTWSDVPTHKAVPCPTPGAHVLLTPLVIMKSRQIT